LHPDATPREIANAQRERKGIVHSFFAQHNSARTIAAMRQFGEELGLRPEQYDPHGVGGVEFDAIWAAALKANHRYTRIARTPDGGYTVPEV
jgi:hypothetical protein